MRSIERWYPSWDYDGKRILGHVDYKVVLWDATTGKVLHKWRDHQERIFSARLSPDGLHAFTSSWVWPGEIGYKSKDTRTIVWNLTTGNRTADFPGDIAREFSSDGKRILAFSGPRRGNLSSFDAAVLSATHGAHITKAKLDKGSDPYSDTLHFSPDERSFALIKQGRYVVINSTWGVLYDATDGREIRKSTRQGDGHRYTSNGDLVSLDRDQAILTDLQSGRIQKIPHEVKSFRIAAWAHDGKRVAVTTPFSDKEEIKIWDIESRTLTEGVRPHPKWTNIFLVSPDNQRLAVESGYNLEDHPELRLYDMKTGKEIERMKLAQWGHVIGFSPDSKTILVGGQEFVIYDAENGKEIRKLKLLDDVSFSHDWQQ